MSREWGSPPWRIDVALRADVPPARVDVAVVGGGLTGLGAAYALAHRGVGVAVLEAAVIGAGASGRTGAIVLEHTAAGPLDGMNDCLTHLTRIVEREGIACDLDLRGCWETSHRPASVRASASGSAAAPTGDRVDGGNGPRWRDGDAELVVSEVVPGGTLDAGALLAGLAHAALDRGATIHEHSEVATISPGTPVRLGVRRNGREHVVEATHVVLALNAYTATVLPLAVEIVPSLTLALATAPLDDATIDAIGLGPRLPFYTADLPYLWGRLLADGRVVFGSGLAFDPDRRVERLAITRGEAATALARLEERVRGFHPLLASAAVDRRWGGPIAFRAGWAPLLARHPQSPTVIVTGAYAGHGVAQSVKAGALAAAAIAGERDLPHWGTFAR